MGKSMIISSPSIHEQFSWFTSRKKSQRPRVISLHHATTTLIQCLERWKSLCRKQAVSLVLLFVVVGQGILVGTTCNREFRGNPLISFGTYTSINTTNEVPSHEQDHDTLSSHSFLNFTSAGSGVDVCGRKCIVPHIHFCVSVPPV